MESLENLVTNARNGDVAAFGRLVRRFQDMACGYAYSILGDSQTAQDVAQDAFVEAYLKLGDLRIANGFPGWLRKIVYKYCDRKFRARNHTTVDLSVIESTVPSEDDLEVNAERRDIRHRVLSAIRELPDNQRTATTLFYINGYSEQEVAGFLEVPVSTVKKRLYDARKSLKESMMDIIGESLQNTRPDDTFAGKVARTVAVFAAKGPAASHMFTDWWHAQRWKWGELTKMGDEGFRIGSALSNSTNAKVRSGAVTYFGIMQDARSTACLRRMLDDKAKAVRGRALRWYCQHVGGQQERSAEGASGSCASSGIRDALHVLTDPTTKIRWNAVNSIGPFVNKGDNAIDSAIRACLRDPKHKVRHQAARVLGIPCPDCGGK